MTIIQPVSRYGSYVVGPVSPGVPPGGSTASLYDGQVATRTFISSNLTAGQTQAMCRSFHYARDAISSLKLLFQDAYGVSETATGATTTIEASIEYPENTFTRVQFSGADAGSLTSGGTLISDETTVSIPSGAKFWIRHYRLNANGFIYNLYAARNDAEGDQTQAGASVPNVVMGGSITSNIAFTATPQAIIGQTRKPSVFLLGDSRVIGVGDNFTSNTSGDTGEFARTIGPEFAYINAGLAGDRISGFLAAPTKRLALSAYCSHIAVNFGINDVKSGAAAATIKTNLLIMWGILLNNKDGLFQSTLPPVSTSTDGWTTLVNQTTNANNANRVTTNTFIRTTPDVLDAYFEMANSVESSPDSGLWAINLTSDGTHENETGYTKEVTDAVIDPSLIVRGPDLTGATSAQKFFAEWDTAPTPAVSAIYSAYIDALTTAGIWAKLDVLYVTGAPDNQSARVNLISPRSFRLTRYNAPTFAAFDGFTGNGTDADLSTNWQPSRDAVHYAQNSASLFVWSNENTRANAVLVGYAASGVKAYLNPWNSSSDTCGHTLNTGSLANGFAPSTAKGLFTLTRTGAAGYDVYRGSTLLGTQTVASTGVPSTPLRICSGAAFYDSTRTVSVFGAGSGLTGTEISDLNAATSTLITALEAI